MFNTDIGGAILLEAKDMWRSINACGAIHDQREIWEGRCMKCRWSGRGGRLGLVGRVGVEQKFERGCRRVRS